MQHAKVNTFRGLEYRGCLGHDLSFSLDKLLNEAKRKLTGRQSHEQKLVFEKSSVVSFQFLTPILVANVC